MKDAPPGAKIAKEQKDNEIHGYWIIDVESEEEAYKIAARASLAPAPTGTPDTMPIEVRQVMSGPPEELL